MYQLVRPRPDPRRHLARPVRGPERRRLPGRPGALCLRARRAARDRARRPGCRWSAGGLPIPAVHTDFPFAALGEELGLIGILAILGLYLVVVERGLRIAASAARRVPRAPRRRARARDRRPGVHHRRGQPQADPADRDHAAVHQLRRLVAARERGRRRAAAGAVRPRRRAAAAAATAAGMPARSAASPDGGARDEPPDAAAPTPGRDPIGPAAIGRGARRVGLLGSPSRSSPPAPATGRSSDRPTWSARPTTPLSSRPPGTSSAGEIVDRDGTVLATRTSGTRTASRTGSTPSEAVAPVIGYASRQFGTAGLERACNAELTGQSGGRSAGRAPAQVRDRAVPSRRT